MEVTKRRFAWPLPANIRIWIAETRQLKARVEVAIEAMRDQSVPEDSLATLKRKLEGADFRR